MAIFKYTAVDYVGRKVHGRIKAKDRASVVSTLRKGQLYIISIVEIDEKKAWLFAQKRMVRPEELMVFSRQLSALVKAGIPLVKSLNTLFNQVENRHFKEIISTIFTDIEAGKSLSDALSSHPETFPPLYINLIRAGEVSGALEVILERLSSYLEGATKLNRKVKSAFIYPAVVLAFAFLITALILLKVIPSFKNIYDQMGARLPIPTQVAIKFSDWTKQYFLVFLVATPLLFFLFKFLMHQPAFRLKWDKFKLNMPVFGLLLRKVIIARFARTLATLLRSGVPIFSALDTASKTSGNRVVEMTLEQVRMQVSKGEKIADSLTQSNVFPPLVVNLIAVGEETGELPGMLERVALFYEDEVDSSVSGLTSLIEPFIIIFLGVVIGGIVLAMFLPILQLTRLVGGAR
ncbi:MAG: type II secretion system F family protein [Candidatus Omnitrophota bacterium]